MYILHIYTHIYIEILDINIFKYAYCSFMLYAHTYKIKCIYLI